MPEEKEPQVQESQFFDFDGELRDAWGRPAEEMEAVSFEESKYSSQTVVELKDELTRRRQAGREFDTSQIKNKRDLVAALEEDDRRQAEEAEDQDPPQE